MNSYVLKINLWAIAVLLLAAGSLVLWRGYSVSAQNAGSSGNCELKAEVLNNRSKLLAKYKQSEDKKFQAERQIWAKRIAYAGRWLPKEAESAREKLYDYDKRHKSLTDEIDKQIEDYKYLEATPLDCSDAKKAELDKKLKEVTGKTDGKPTGGQAKIEFLKRQETKYAKTEFKKATTSLIKKLHKAKAKNSVPKLDPLKVD